MVARSGLRTVAGFGPLGVCYLVIFLALRSNTFAAVNIDVELGQQVVLAGPYAVIRHPYYAGLLLWVLATPLALGSWRVSSGSFPWPCFYRRGCILSDIGWCRQRARFGAEHAAKQICAYNV